jgi:phospholipase C
VRKLIQVGVMLALAASPLACVSEADGQGASASESDLSVPASWDAPTERIRESLTKTLRDQCTFRRGSMPAQSLGKEIPLGDDIPIQNIVVFTQENRSFDSYFGRLGKYLGRDDIESPPEGASNPTANGEAVAWQHAPRLCMPDTNHEWGGVHRQLNDGRMDGFFLTNDGWTEDRHDLSKDLLNGSRAMWFYDERDIPYYYDLAKTFAIADHYFSSVPGPTYPNRQYLYAATSFGVTSNHAPSGKLLGENTVIFDELQRRGVTWKIYTAGFPAIPRVGALLGASYMSRWGFLGGGHLASMGDFSNDAEKGTLPQVAFVDASINEDVWGVDEHPPSDIQTGQRWIAQRVDELMQSPQWPHLAAFLTYDEHGGIYDHVVPPEACPPDDIEPVLEGKDDRKFPGRFDHYGARVPFMVVSPWVKKSYVSHVTYDHTSVLRFIEAKFALPAMSSRDANADALFDFFDFSAPSYPTAPRLPIPKVEGRAMSLCVKLLKPPPPPNQRHGSH